jgi:hypothetical protein
MRRAACTCGLLVSAVVAACSPSPVAPAAHEPPTRQPPPPRPETTTEVACENDDHEPDDWPNINDTAERMAAGKANRLELVACPGDVDTIQGVGDFDLRASVTWDPVTGHLDVTLVDSEGHPYVFRDREGGPKSGIVRKPGRVEIRGGSYRQFVRVHNDGPSPIRYQVSLHGIWAE